MIVLLVYIDWFVTLLIMLTLFDVLGTYRRSENFIIKNTSRGSL